MLSVYAGKPLPPPFASCTCWTVCSNDAGSWKMAMTRGRGWINGVQLDANESFRKGNYETELSLESWRRIDLNFERAKGILRSTKFEEKKGEILGFFFFFLTDFNVHASLHDFGYLSYRFIQPSSIFPNLSNRKLFARICRVIEIEN